MTEHHLGEDLAALADGGADLPEARRQELHRHLEGCAACRSALAAARLVLETVDRNLAPPVPSEDFDARLFARLDALDRTAEPSLFERLRAFFTLPRLGFAAAAVGAVLVAFVVTRAPSRSGEPKNAEVAVARELQETELLAMAEDLDLYQDLEVLEDLDVIDDLELIRDLDEKEPG